MMSDAEGEDKLELVLVVLEERRKREASFYTIIVSCLQEKQANLPLGYLYTGRNQIYVTKGTLDGIRRPEAVMSHSKIAERCIAIQDSNRQRGPYLTSLLTATAC